ncbi:MAG: hypothetical protein Q8O00_08740 [Holophaga sp.]|nr:hypothetical protein [Holophaga sp.]
MFSTTLRIQDDLAAFLQEAARASSQSVNTFLTELLERERETARRKRLTADWAAYAREDQDVFYALGAQVETLVERAHPYSMDSKPKVKPEKVVRSSKRKP